MNLVYSISDIKAIAAEFAASTGESQVIAFEGQMGAGKTTFIHAVCASLGVRGTVSSPTFSIINEYESLVGTIYHIDLYRCENEDEAIRAGVEECLYSGSTCLVEWPSKAPGIFPVDTLYVNMTVIDGETRKIEWKSSTTGDTDPDGAHRYRHDKAN